MTVSRFQHKTSLVSCQLNQLALDKLKLPESEALRPINHLLNQAWTSYGIRLLIASFSWIQGLAEVCADSASRWSFKSLLLTPGQTPALLSDLGSFPCLPGSSPSHHLQPQQAGNRKEIFLFLFFFL